MSREQPYKLRFALEATGLSSQTLRHWREVLPPLRHRVAHHPAFSAGDLLAMKVLHLWSRRWDAKISHMECASTGLFELCEAEPWARIEQSLLALDFAHDTWELTGESAHVRWPEGALLLPIGRLARELREHLMGNRTSLQMDIPLMGVVGKNAERSVESGGGR